MAKTERIVRSPKPFEIPALARKAFVFSIDDFRRITEPLIRYGRRGASILRVEVQPRLPTPSARALRTTLRSSTRSPELRSGALQQLVLTSDPQLPGLLVKLLEQDDTPPELRDALIIAAEEVDFESETERTRVAEALLRHARVLQRDDAASSLWVLWAAMRRHASLAQVAHADTLAEFMTAADDLTTRQSALQAIQNVFWSAPPLNSVSLRKVNKRIHDLANTYLKPYLLRSAEDAALALNIVCAAAVIGHERLVHYAKSVRNLENRGFAADVRQTLEEIATSWRSAEPPVAEDAPAFARLKESIDMLGGSS